VLLERLITAVIVAILAAMVAAALLSGMKTAIRVAGRAWLWNEIRLEGVMDETRDLSPLLGPSPFAQNAP